MPGILWISYLLWWSVSSISLHWSLRKAFLSFLAILWNSAFRWVHLSFPPLPFASLLFSAICKASSDSHFAFLHFFFLGMVLLPVSCTMSQTFIHRSDRQSAWRTMDRGLWHCTGDSDQDHSQEKEMQQGKMVVWGGLTNSWEKEVKGKGERERYTHFSAEFQRIARKDKKAFLSDQCKEIEDKGCYSIYGPWERLNT